jgi:hypothetical protein
VARNQATVLAHQRWRRPTPLLDARRDRGDLGIRVGPCIFRVRDQPIDRPALDLIGRPRPLISGSLARVRAAARERGSVGPGAVALVAAMMMGGFAFLGFQVSQVSSKIDAIPQRLSEEFRAMRAEMSAQTSAIANSITATRQAEPPAPPQIIVIPPAPQPQPAPEPPKP